jgi:hypothetical protein
VTIPESVTSIGDDAFYNTGIFNDNSNWENGALYISNCLVDAETSLSGAYTIKNGTRLIADYVFQGRSSLTSVTIPNSVTSIGISAFSGCNSITSITCKATTPPTLGSHNMLYKVTAVYVPADSVEAYKTDTNWSYYSNVIQPI